MTEQETSESAPATPEQESPIPFKQFLETIHPSVKRNVSGLWIDREGSKYGRMNLPELRLHCQSCDGERTFRCGDDQPSLAANSSGKVFITYLCGDCRMDVKSFSLFVARKQNAGGFAYKYGEKPPFGIPVPKKVLRLFGGDRDNFIKGRKCENQGLGIGAFAYYRRVVENHKNEIFEEIIRVCKTVPVPAPEGLIEELRSAQKEVSFTKAMQKIKTALPHGLLINGQNPLLALHNALSIGLHHESDEKCLEAAHDVRLVLTDLIEKMSLLRQDNSELHGAVQRLIAKKGGG
jgi:hypothetical protein